MSQKILKQIFLKAVESVQPSNVISHQVHVTSCHLAVQDTNYSLTKNIYVVGFGKAVLGMAVELEKILLTHLKMGLVTVPDGILKSSPATSAKIRFIEGAANNIPDEKAMIGAKQIKNLAESLDKDDLLIVLISGGGSALLPLPKEPVTLPEKQELITRLSRQGANILELNCVRKSISQLKGGGLAELAYPAQVVGLILSDVVGDPLDFIASGPTTPNFDEADAAKKVIEKYGLWQDLPESIRLVLGTPPKKSELIEKGRYKNVDNFIMGNNERAAKAAESCAKSLGFQTCVLSTTLTGNADKISELYAGLTRELLTKQAAAVIPREFSLNATFLLFDVNKPICLIGAGEPTVVVRGGGKGGRNQQLALDFSLKLHNYLENLIADPSLWNVSFLSAGTDGIDGPTDAAGAIGTFDLVNNCRTQNINPQDYSENNDAYTFYQKYSGGANHVKTGHTGTNVMDLHILLIEQAKK